MNIHGTSNTGSNSDTQQSKLLKLEFVLTFEIRIVPTFEIGLFCFTLTLFTYVKCLRFIQIK